jgi:transposase
VLARLLKHRSALFTHVQARWKDLFGARYEVRLYDLTSTHVEGQAEQIPKAQFGHSRDHRPDCRQVVLALVEIQLPTAQTGTQQQPKQGVKPGGFKFRLLKEALKEAELDDGHYLLRSNLSDQEPEWLWKLYMLLVEIEAVFKSFKNDLGLRPIYHSVEARVEAHSFVCFLA